MAIDQKKFNEAGLIHLKNIIPKNLCSEIKQNIFNELERLGLRKSGKLSASKISHLPIFQQISHLAQKINIESQLAGLISKELMEIMQSLAGGQRLTPMHSSPQLLLSLPHRKEWSLEGLNWHLDKAIPLTDEVIGIQAFLILDDLRPQGGATLALAGSHKIPYLKENFQQAAISILQKDSFFKDLFNNKNQVSEFFFKPYDLGGVKVHIVEMTGKAGDVYLMDMRVLHSPSINATSHLRMMATNRFLK